MVHNRQFDLTLVLENVHDPYNIGAVLRSCDSVGIREIFVLYTEPGLFENRLSIGRRTAMGSQKWVDVHLYKSIEPCFRHIRQNYDKVYGTYMDESSKSIYDLDLTQSVALLFGNENGGLSEELRKRTDGNFLIPQKGMAQSLNISVAAAVSVYEAMRQRTQAGLYGHDNPASQDQIENLTQDYIQRHENEYDGKEIEPKG